MKLCYRGVEYDYNPPSLEMKDSEITGCYRGRTLTFAYPSHVPVPQPVARYTYRGVGYETTAEGHPQPLGVSTETDVRQPVFQGIKAADSPMMQARRHLLMEASTAHRTNIQRSLDHRLAVARAQGTERLVQQLEEELHPLA